MKTALNQLAVINDGDKKQLAYIRDRYNYLLQQKWDVDSSINAAKQQNKDLSTLISHSAILKEEMLMLDSLRTELIID